MKNLAIIGECMIELNGKPFGQMKQTFGGDTLNAAVYAARSSNSKDVCISYVTALGSDPLSKGMLSRWQEEGIDTSNVLIDPTRTVGAYLIQVDETGERTFIYWRNNSPASQLVKHADYPVIEQRLINNTDMLFLSGISLAIMEREDRHKLIETISECRKNGAEIAFDSNFRPMLWGNDIVQTRADYLRMFNLVDLALVTFDDEAAIWGDKTPEQTIVRLKQLGIRYIVVKLGADGCLLSTPETDKAVSIATTPSNNIVDTTSAGDSFNGAFLASYLSGKQLTDCCKAGNELAGIVIQHRGAIIDKSVMEQSH